MNKEDLHNSLQKVRDGYKDMAIIPESAIIDIYGNNEARKIDGIQKVRADILASVYKLDVTKDTNDYIFVRKS